MGYDMEKDRITWESDLADKQFFNLSYKFIRNLHDDEVPEIPKIKASIMLTADTWEDEEGDMDTKIGYIKGYLFDMYQLRGKYDLLTHYEIFEVEAELIQYYNSFFTKHGKIRSSNKKLLELDEQASSKFLIIHELQIDEPFRGKGIGLAALSQIIEEFGKDCQAIMIMAFPIQHSGKATQITPLGISSNEYTHEFLEDQASLFSYYSRLGFKRFGKTDIMGLSYKMLIPHFLAE